MASQVSYGYRKMSVIRGYHIYKSFWTPVIGEGMAVKVEDGDECNDDAVVVMKAGCVVGHVPLSQDTWHLFEAQCL